MCLGGFNKYQHIENYPSYKLNGITRGTVYIFTKLDGACGSVWYDNGNINCASRNNVLDNKNNNHGFYQYIKQNNEIKSFFEKYPNMILYGEWLIQHKEKYNPDAMTKFYVFDVVSIDENNKKKYICFEEYSKILDEFKIPYIPLIAEIKNPTDEKIMYYLKNATFLKENPNETGEGIVIKNYDYVNSNGKIIWGKVINEEFKIKKKSKNEKEDFDKQFVDKYMTEHFFDKERIKYNNEKKNDNNEDLINYIFNKIIEEEIINYIMALPKKPIINFQKIKSLICKKIEEYNKVEQTIKNDDLENKCEKSKLGKPTKAEINSKKFETEQKFVEYYMTKYFFEIDKKDFDDKKLNNETFNKYILCNILENHMVKYIMSLQELPIINFQKITSLIHIKIKEYNSSGV